MSSGPASRRWDLILVEDSGRLFRHETACGELIETAVDNGIRVLCLNDDVDTAEEDWEDPLHEAMRHHARANRFTSKRLKRRFDSLWRQGAAVGQLRTGYRRKPTRPATAHEPEAGPFFDEIDPRWAPVVHEAYERIARRDPAWSVAQWLTQKGLPKCASALTTTWSERNVLELIRRTVYRGVERYRFTVVRKHYGSGKHPQVRNDPGEVKTRDMPHLRIVSDRLWQTANQAITDRKLGAAPPTGIDHPLAGIPRNSRGPLSGLFLCGICGGKMYREGRVDGGYRCSNAPRGTCWNKATAPQDLTHERIGQAIRDPLLSADGVWDVILEEVPHRLRDEGPLQARKAELQAQETKLGIARQRLVNAIETDADTLEVLVARLREREHDLARVRDEIEQVDAQLAHRADLPSREEIREAVGALARQVPVMYRETGALLRELVSPIRAVPLLQFGNNLVVLRAQFELRQVALLPQQWQALFRGTALEPIPGRVETVSTRVELFKRSAGPAFFERALEMSRANKTLVEIGRELGVTKRQAHIAVQYGRDLCAAGLTDPYLELTESPAAASRWRTHPQFKKSE